MRTPRLDTAGVSGEVIMTQLAGRFAAANVSPVLEEPLWPRATGLLEPTVDKHLGMDNRAEGVLDPHFLNHPVYIEVLLHSLSHFNKFALGFDRLGYHASEDL